MSGPLMILPSSDPAAIRLVRIPEDFEEHEVFRHVTGLIARLAEEDPGYDWDDVAAVLEDHGFEPEEFILGPSLD